MSEASFFCPKCSGNIEFDAGPDDTTTAECGSCGLRFSRGELKRIAWQQSIEDRVRAVDALQWWREPAREGQDAGWLLVKLASGLEREQRDALEALRVLVIRDGQAAPIAQSVEPILREIATSLPSDLADRARTLLDELASMR